MYILIARIRKVAGDGDFDRICFIDAIDDKQAKCYQIQRSVFEKEGNLIIF